MPPKKRGGGDGRRRSDENKRFCRDSGETTESGVWSQLSEEVALTISKSVVSLALSDGHKVLCAFSGIAIHCQPHVSKFLTSASLVRALDNEVKCHDNVKIEVRHDGNVVTGFLEEYDLDYQIAIVKITSSLDVHKVFLNHALNFVLDCNVVAVGRDIGGKLLVTSGNLTSNPSGSEHSEVLMFSTCKLSEAWDGGAHFDFHGNFVGMNLYWRTGVSLFVPVSIIIERMEHFRTHQQRIAYLDWVKDLRTLRVTKSDLCSRPEAHQDTTYPRRSTSHFGDVYPKGVWEQFNQKVSRRISRNVVALASFNGDTRFFACSGFFIDWNESQDINVSTILTSATLVRNSDPSVLDNGIFDGLRIKVLLPKGKCIEGTLMHCNLHYNVALVSVKNYTAASPAILKHKKRSSELIAVGRCFNSGHLMASRGKLVGWSGSLDCEILQYSTCKITTAGIGGPLVDDDGNYIGMNFYDPKMGTPALFHDDILSILKGFKKTRNHTSGPNGDNTVCMNRWPVPEPDWRNPSNPEPYLSDYERRVLASGRGYKYISGYIVRCK